ncbi:hypothetical protein ACFYKX_12430 [Cytobacillus sp. FJAT-54145]|uniref:Uncharacterized protein n=1 Tax=Cytobacillus spartinae TaxID=3299023 RepID=A0ABW6KET0_9BACI
MGNNLPCCPDLQPPASFFDVTCIEGREGFDEEYRVALISVENPTDDTTEVTYQVCRCAGDISHVTFEVCGAGPTPIAMGESPNVLPPNTEPDNLPYTSAKFEWTFGDDDCAELVLTYDTAFQFEEGVTFREIEVSIFQAGELFTSTILGPCFGEA